MALLLLLFTELTSLYGLELTPAVAAAWWDIVWNSWKDSYRALALLTASMPGIDWINLTI